MDSLLRIVVGEHEFNSNQRNIYKCIEDFLWKEGFPGLTIRRVELSLDYKSIMHSIAIEDIEFNDLAIIIETVADNNKIEKARQDIIKYITHGQATVIKGMEENCISELKNLVEEGAVFTTPIDLIMNK